MPNTVSVGGDTKRILGAAVTSGQPPEEVLGQLDRYGVEWYLAERGDLMFDAWQVGAEKVVAPEQVPALQTATPPPQANALDWVSHNLAELRQQYAGQWVAILGEEVAVSAPTLQELLDRIGRLAINRPFITQIPAEQITWITTYAGLLV